MRIFTKDAHPYMHYLYTYTRIRHAQVYKKNRKQRKKCESSNNIPDLLGRISLTSPSYIYNSDAICLPFDAEV